MIFLLLSYFALGTALVSNYPRSMGAVVINGGRFVRPAQIDQGITKLGKELSNAVVVHKRMVGYTSKFSFSLSLWQHDINEGGAPDKTARNASDSGSDVHISAPSSYNLANRSLVVYELLRPLSNLTAGMKRFSEWVARQVRTIYCRAVCLVSERIARDLEVIQNRVLFASTTNHNRNAHKVLNWLIDQIWVVAARPPPTADTMETAVLCTDALRWDKDAGVCADLERGSIDFRRRGTADNTFHMGVPLVSLLAMTRHNWYGAEELDRHPRLKTFIRLVQTVVPWRPVTDIWGRTLDASILISSLSGLGGVVGVAEIFGLPAATNLTVLSSQAGQLFGPEVFALNNNVQLTLPRRQDYSKYRVVCADGRVIVVAAHTVVDVSSGAIDKIYGEAIADTIHDPLTELDAEHGGLDSLWIVFYNHAMQDGTINWDAVASAAEQYARQWPAATRGEIRRYFEQYRCNVHVVPRPVLQEWLVPSFVDVPALILESAQAEE